MDRILQATRISLPELLPSPSPARSKTLTHCEDCGAFSSIPIVSEVDCTATDIPKQSVRHTLKIATSVLERLPAQMDFPRPHWQRFIGFHVKAADIVAMHPRFVRGTVAIIDRHHNSPSPGKNSSPDIFLVRLSSGMALRYVERVEHGLLARPHNPNVPSEFLRPLGGSDPYSSVIGRVCFLHVQL